MYNVKIIITNQNSVKNTTAEIFSAMRKFVILFAILSYIAILFTILEKFCNNFCNVSIFCNNFCNTWNIYNKYCNNLRFCNTYCNTLWCCNTKVLQYFTKYCNTILLEHPWLWMNKKWKIEGRRNGRSNKGNKRNILIMISW